MYTKTFHPLWKKFTKRTGRILPCLLLSTALLLTGCSGLSDSSKNNSSQASSKEASDSKETGSSSREKPDSGSKTDSDSGQEPASNSSEASFDFNASLSLKVPDQPAGDTPRILFVGNSHTYTNNLPDIFNELAAAMGHESEVYELSEGSYHLEQFADANDELGAVLHQSLAEKSWDFVILQENTNDAFSFAEQKMLPAAAALDEKIRAANGQTALLMTWSPKTGAGAMSLEEVQAELTQNYINVSKELDSLLIPGGAAFMRCLERYPQIELWNEDEMHPSLAGSYLTACIAYAVIFQESPAGCTYAADLDSDTASQLQQLAGEFLTE